jgi:N-acetylglutamate synthase-like GNAT family acetyltransferase
MLQEPVDVKDLSVELVDELRLPLVNRFYSLCRYRIKCGRLDKVYSVFFGGEIIAAARFLLQKSGHFLLRNLCVAPAVRNRGVATYLLNRALHDLRLTAASSNCYCFALPHLKNFYLSLDFRVFSPDEITFNQLPQDIAEMHSRNCARNRDWILMGFVIA